MSTPSSASNNRTELIYQRNNRSSNSWEVSEAPSCENLVVDREFPDQSSMDCHKKYFNSRNSSSTQEDESHPSAHLQLCEFHQRIVHQQSPRRTHHTSKCSINSDRKFNQDHVRQLEELEELTPISCRTNSNPERISRSKDQDRLSQAAKCSASSNEVEGVENRRNTSRTPRSVYTKQPIDVHPQDVQGDTNEGCCKYSSPNVKKSHLCATPTSTDSGPDADEKKRSKKFCDSSTSPIWNDTTVHFPFSSFKKQKSFEQDVSREYSRTKAKASCFDPYTTTDFFSKACDSTTVQTLQELPLKKNLRSSKTTNEMDPYNLQFLIGAESPCSSCIRRRSSRKDTLQNAFKEAYFSRNPGEEMIRRSSCNKANIAKCMSAREMPCEPLKSHSSGKQCCPSKCPSHPLKVSYTCKATNTVPSRENVQIRKLVSPRDCVTSECDEDSLPKDLEGTSEVTIYKTDANRNYTGCFPYSKCDDCSEKIAVSQANICPANACSFACTNVSSPSLSKVGQNQVQLPADLKQAMRLCTPSRCTPETERSSGYHSDILERGSPSGMLLTSPRLNLESRAFKEAPFAKCTVRSSSSNVSTTSESSQNCKKTLTQQKSPRYSKPSFLANDALSRITERSSDEDFRKPHCLAKSAVSFREDTQFPDSELEINSPETGLRQETKMPCCRQRTPRSILRQDGPEQTNEACANPERSSHTNASPKLVSIHTSRQYSISCPPEYVSDAAKMFIENTKQPLQTCMKPNLKVRVSKRSGGRVGTNKDKENILQNEEVARNIESTPPCMAGQSNGLKRNSCPIHSSQINSGSSQFKPGFSLSQKQLSCCHNQTSQNVSLSSQNLSNKESRNNFKAVPTKAKSEYFQTKCFGQCIPKSQVPSKPKVLSSINRQPPPAKISQLQISSHVDFWDSKSEEQPTELPFQNSSRPFTARSNANLSSSKITRNDTRICTEDRSSKNQSPCSFEADVDPKQQIGFTVELNKPFEVARISYSRTIQPKSGESQKEAYTKQSESPATGPKQEHHKSSLKSNPSNKVLRSCRSICRSLNKSSTDDQDLEKDQSLSAFGKLSQCGASELKASEAYTSEKTQLFEQFPENYRGSKQTNHPMYISTQEQPSIIETSNSILSVAAGSNYKDIFEDFPDDQEGELPCQSLYINSEEELSFCEASNSKAKGALTSTISFKSTETGKQGENANMPFPSCDTQEPIDLTKTLSFQRICSGCNSDPSKELGASEKISERQETQKEIVDETVQMHADQNLGTENNETTASTWSLSARRIYDSCLQKCSKIGKVKAELKKLQMHHKGEMPDTCQARPQCELLKCGGAPLRECQSVGPNDFGCELHHKDDSMCIYIDLCKCTGGKENIGLKTARNLTKFRYNNDTRPHLPGFGGPSGTGRKTEENNFGAVCREPNNQRRIYRTLSTQTRNECENHKQSIPKKVKWAVAKISEFDDSSKTYELMQVEPIKPMIRSPNSDSVVIVVPENRN